MPIHGSARWYAKQDVRRSAHRLALLRQMHNAKATLTNYLKDLVRARAIRDCSLWSKPLGHRPSRRR